MNRNPAGLLIVSMLAAGGVLAAEKWVHVNNTHGWSLNYPGSWEAYVMQAPKSGKELSIQKSDNVNFDGPKGCYERKERCGLFQVSVDSEEANPHLDLKKYVDEDVQGRTVMSRESGELDGLPAYFIKLPEDQRLVLVKSKGLVFRISYGPNDHKPTDKGLEEIFVRMMSSLKFNK